MLQNFLSNCNMENLHVLCVLVYFFNILISQLVPSSIVILLLNLVAVLSLQKLYM